MSKPNGKESGVFVISIDDGYVEYSYDYTIGGHNSIAGVAKKLAKALRRVARNARLRTTHIDQKLGVPQ